MATSDSSPAPQKRQDEFFVKMPFLIELVPEHDRDRPRDQVYLYRYDHNACELKGAGSCDTVAGLYYGTIDKFGGKLCPRHFYESVFGPDRPYTLIDPNDKASDTL